MDDLYFWELLGLAPGADRRAIKRAYHRLARRNHPDFFPTDQKPLQELRMITLNEAYAYLLDRRPGELPAEPEPGAAGEPPPEEKSAASAGVGFHREPAYAYYKQGFIHYSRAVHGIEARDDAAERFAAGLTELRRAHEYFTRVAEEHAGSGWAPDARVKLARIERFSGLYRKILRNLQGSAPAP